MRPYVVGVTGGIGSGKTTVCNAFRSRHAVPVVDADIVAREVVEPGKPALARIVEALGPSVLDDGGGLDRRGVRRIVFADEAKRRALEEILHPEIRRAMRARVDGLDTVYCLVCIPLLAEGGRTDFLDRVLVVDCPEALQIERVRTRDQLTEKEVIAIMRTQASRQERLRIADDVIVNDGDAVLLRKRVDELHQLYTRLSMTRV